VLKSFHVFLVKPTKIKNIRKGLGKDTKQIHETHVILMKYIAQESSDKLLIARHM